MSTVLLLWILTTQPSCVEMLTDAVILSVDDETYEDTFA